MPELPPYERVDVRDGGGEPSRSERARASKGIHLTGVVTQRKGSSLDGQRLADGIVEFSRSRDPTAIADAMVRMWTDGQRRRAIDPRGPERVQRASWNQT